MLVDKATLYVRSGDGGNGSMSFRREKYAPKGGPDGGDGGRGGDVVFRVNPHLSSLIEFQAHNRFIARNGSPGASRKKHGKSASPTIIRVPQGTVVWDDDEGEILADLTEQDDSFVVARGGSGGYGNCRFKTSMRQAPRIAELGAPGEEFNLRLELRIIADVGLVGLPNAGKSTLLSASTRAQPKIADYPFTTLSPNLGVVQIGGRSGSTFVMADLPGLIEGAAEGQGLGHEFLRHVSRTKMIIHVLDASGGLEGRNPLHDFDLINAELAAYGQDLSNLPMFVALNKTDLIEARDNVVQLRNAITDKDIPIFEISAATGEGVDELLNAVMVRVEAIRRDAPPPVRPQDTKIYTLDQTDERAWTIEKSNDSEFVISGRAIERLAKMTNFDQEDAVDRFQRVLIVSGISDELDRQGVEAGDTVSIGQIEMAWGEEYELEGYVPPRLSSKTRRLNAQYQEEDVAEADES